MDWLNLHTSTMDSPEFVGSDTKERGIWLSLLRYCIGQENGGTISGCKLWKDRQWQQLARVTLREVSSDCRLYSWESENLVVWGYPKDKQDEILRKRELARLNGKTGGRPKIGSEVITNKEPMLVISPKAEGNGMEGEWNGIELGQAALPLPIEPKKFVKPTAAQVVEYAAEIGFQINGGKFIDHYEANGWLVGKNKMRDWKATVRTWKHRDEDQPNTQKIRIGL